MFGDYDILDGTCVCHHHHVHAVDLRAADKATPLSTS
jgi:UDP-glucose 4-epimerase